MRDREWDETDRTSTREHLMSVAETSKLLGCNQRFTLKLLRYGFLPYLAFGRSKRVIYSGFCRSLQDYQGQDIRAIISLREQEDDAPATLRAI